MVFIGIDLGGTNAKAGVVRGNGDLLAKHEIPLTNKDVDAVVEALSECVRKALEKCVPRRYESEIITIGIGSPGEVRDGYVIHAANFPGWSMVPLALFMSKQFGNRPTVLVNDADAAVISEWWVGAAKTCNVKDFVMFTLGTGVGCGMVCNGTVVHGNSGLVEGGHMIMNPFGPRCACSQRGCLETYASATSVVRRALELTKRYHRQYQAQKRSSIHSSFLTSLSCDDIEQSNEGNTPTPTIHPTFPNKSVLLGDSGRHTVTNNLPSISAKTMAQMVGYCHEIPHAQSSDILNKHHHLIQPGHRMNLMTTTSIPETPNSTHLPSFDPFTPHQNKIFTFDANALINDPITPRLSHSENLKMMANNKEFSMGNTDNSIKNLKKPLLISKLIKFEAQYALCASPSNNNKKSQQGYTSSANSPGLDNKGTTGHKISMYSQIGAHEVFEAAYKGDIASIQAIDEACEMLGLACVNVSRLLDVELILFSGGMTHAGNYLFSRIRNAYAKYTWKTLPNNTKILPAQVGNDSGIIGAAGIGKNRFLGSFDCNTEKKGVGIAPNTDTEIRDASINCIQRVKQEASLMINESILSHELLGVHLESTNPPPIKLTTTNKDELEETLALN